MSGAPRTVCTSASRDRASTLGPSVAAVSGNRHGGIEVVAGAVGIGAGRGGRPGLGAVEANAGALDQGVCVVQPHVARGGEAQRGLDGAERLVP